LPIFIDFAKNSGNPENILEADPCLVPAIPAICPGDGSLAAYPILFIVLCDIRDL
jgi:hypothetical protein